MPPLGSTCGVGVVGQVVASGGQVRKVVNTFVYRNPNPGGAGTLNNFIAAFDTNVWAAVAPLLHTDYVGVSYQGYFPAFIDPTNAVTFPNTRNGGAPGGRLPLHVAANVRFLTALRGKSFLGLKRFSPISSLSVSKDELTPGAIAAAAPILAAMLAQFTDSFGRVWIPVVLSRQLSTNPPPVFIAVGADVTAVTINKTLGLARHRRERTVR